MPVGLQRLHSGSRMASPMRWPTMFRLGWRWEFLMVFDLASLKLLHSASETP